MQKEIKNDYFGTARKILRALGISLYENESVTYKIYSYTFLTLFPYLYCILSIVELFKDHNFEDFSVTFVYNGCLVLAIMKTIVVLLNRKQLGNILNSLQTGVFAPNYERGGDAEGKLIQDCIKQNNLQRTAYLTADIASLGGSIVNALVKRVTSSDYHNWDLGFGSFSVVDITRSPNFELIMIYQDISFVFCGLTFMMTDLMFVEILSHVAVQFKIVQNNLKFLIENTRRRMQKNLESSNSLKADGRIPKRHLNESLKEVIIHHLSVIEVADEIEKIYAPLLLIIYVSNMMILCFGIYMVSVLSDPSKRFAFITGQSSVCFQLFVTCYWSDRMTRESRAVGDAAYQTNFVGTHPNFQKLLIFIMQRSMKPSVMTAGRFFSITLPSFLKILQATYSFIMVVQKRQS